MMEVDSYDPHTDNGHIFSNVLVYFGNKSCSYYSNYSRGYFTEKMVFV